jgi:hypothetical protein
VEIQLEFNFDNKTPEEMTLYLMQKQIDKIAISTEKVRKKLFAELGEVKGLVAALRQENEDLKSILRGLGHGTTQYTYRQNGRLFDVHEYQGIAS